MTEITKPEFTRKEAEAHTQRILNHANETRWLLLEAYERKAHKALSYGNFEDYTTERLQMPISADALSRMVRWAETERNVLGRKVDTCVNFSEPSEPKLAWRVAEQLAKLPTPELQKQTYSEMEALRHQGMQKPSEYLASLKRIVARRLKGDTEPITATPQNASQPAPVSPVSESIPNAFEQDIASIQTPAPHEKPVSSLKPAVSSYSPPADAEPITLPETPPDFEEWLLALDTATAMVKNQTRESNARVCRLTACSLRELATWMEYVG